MRLAAAGWSRLFRKLPLNAWAARLGAAVALVNLASCATTPPPPQQDTPQISVVRDCTGLFERYDASVAQANVGDAGGYRIQGFPYLRTNRFLASFRPEAGRDSEMFQAWLGRMQDLASQARHYELANIPYSYSLVAATTKSVLEHYLSECATILASADSALPNRRADLLENAQTPDEYSIAKRSIGFYPLARIPFFMGVKQWQCGILEAFQNPRRKAGSNVLRYVPAGGLPGPTMLKAAPTDALGIPRYDPETLERLFQAYAPAYEIESGGEFDRIGALAWAGESLPSVQTSLPTVYRRLAFTRYHGAVLPQLVYSVWFSERPPAKPFDLLSGRLDGLLFRITLDKAGRPLLYDSIHPCGCYHLFFPTDRLRPLPPPSAGEEWAFIPKPAPALQAGQRLVLSIASGSHYLVDIYPDESHAGIGYAFAEDDDLRSLPEAKPCARRSAFGPDGIIHGTERLERFFFWPMGVADSGAMRQWGRHASAFVGRRHFDDADLLEKRFIEQPMDKSWDTGTPWLQTCP